MSLAVTLWLVSLIMKQMVPTVVDQLPNLYSVE